MIVEDLAATLQALGIDAHHSGGQYHAICPHPDHQDSKPSWAIKATVDKHPHACWACEYKGNIFDLVVERLKLRGPRRYAEAEEWLRGRSRSIVARELSFRIEDPTARVCAFPEGVCFGPLAQWPSMARRGVEERGITAAQVTSWNIGYAMLGRLAGRIVFPAYDERGDLLTYTARTFVGDEVRYLSGDERADGARTDAVFGEDRWQNDAPVVLGEGAIKVLAVERAAPQVHVAAIFGSKPSALHVWKLARFDRVVVMTDADNAGEHAAFVLSALGSRAIRYSPPCDPDEMPPDEVRAGLLQALGGQW